MELGAFSVSLAVKDIEASKLFYEKLATRTRLRERIRRRIPVQADGSISMTARAWAVRATVAR